MSKSNSIMIEGKKLEFLYPIGSVIEVENKYIVLLKIPTRIELSEEELSNVYCYDKNATLLWRIDKDLPSTIKSSDRLPYIAINFNDKKLTATDFMGRRFQVDIETGKLLNMDVVR